MKRVILIVSTFVLLSISCFGETFKTGDSMLYFPKGAPMVSSKGGDSSKCFISKIAQANGYPNGWFEFQVTSCDWIGASVFPISFTYIVKKNDVIELVQSQNAYTGPDVVQFTVKSVADNIIELEMKEQKYGEVKPSDDSL